MQCSTCPKWVHRSAPHPPTRNLNAFQALISCAALSAASRFLLEQRFPNQGCAMVIQIFVLHYSTIMLSSSCAKCSAQYVSNYIMTSARPSMQHEMMMLISKKKKVNTFNFGGDFKIGPHLGPKHVMNSSHVKIF